MFNELHAVNALGHLAQDRPTDPDALWAKFEALLAPFGLCSIQYESGVPRDGSARRCLRSDHPDAQTFGRLICTEFVDILHAEPRYQEADAFFRHCESSLSPLVYDAGAAGDFPKVMQEVNDIARDFTVTGGIVVPLHGFDQSTFGNVTFLVNRASEFTPGDLPLAQLTALAHMLHGVMRQHVPPVAGDLTRQEITCLTWVAAGLSTKRLSHRMGISDATANEYIRNACKKLGATTRAEAVAKAVAHGFVVV